MNDNWKFLIYNFKRLGGNLENIQIKSGNLGRGLFSINPNKKSQIFVPRSLFIRANDISLSSNTLFVKNNTFYSKDIIDFFNFYFTFFVNDEIKKSIINFEEDLNSLNPSTKKIFNLFLDQEKRQQSFDKLIFNSYLDSRACDSFDSRNSKVIIPIFELMNHDIKSPPCLISKKGITSPNYSPFRGELKINYGTQSSLKRFFQFHFFSKETIVCSLPFSIDLKDSGFIFTCNGNDFDEKSLNSIEKNSNGLTIDGLLLADLNNKNYPYQYFKKIMRKFDNLNDIPDKFFGIIINYNIFTRKKMIEEIKSNHKNNIKILSSVLEYEISLLTENLKPGSKT